MKHAEFGLVVRFVADAGLTAKGSQIDPDRLCEFVRARLGPLAVIDGFSAMTVELSTVLTQDELQSFEAFEPETPRCPECRGLGLKLQFARVLRGTNSVGAFALSSCPACLGSGTLPMAKP